jgi:hypothetical protein
MFLGGGVGGAGSWQLSFPACHSGLRPLPAIPHMCPCLGLREGCFGCDLLRMARAGLDRAPIPRVWIACNCRDTFGQTRNRGSLLLIWNPRVSLSLLDESCQWPTSPSIVHLGPSLFSRLPQAGLDHVVPAIWGREVILIRLHPPPGVFFTQNTVQDWPTLVALQKPTLIPLNHSPHLPGLGGKGGGQR